MIFRLLLLYFLLSLNYGCSSQEVDIKRLDIEFDGAKGDFFKKYNLWTEINDSLLVKGIVKAIDTSEALMLCEPHSPVMWEIDVFGINEKEKSDHLFKIGSSLYGRIVLKKGQKCFQNDSLVSFMIDFMRIDAIREYPGEMRQPEYDMIMQKEK